MLKIADLRSYMTLKTLQLKLSRKYEICRKDISRLFGKNINKKKNLGAPRSLTLRAKTAAPAHAHASL